VSAGARRTALSGGGDNAPGAPSDRTRLRRYPARGDYDEATIHAILDEALVCHMGFTVEGQPYVIPTLCARVDDELYVHGSAASRALRELSGGVAVCVTATLIDGLVLARSAFHHSVNYRSVVVLGTAELIDGAADKEAALRRLVERLVPGRWEDVRTPTARELRATSILRLSLTEASAKVRSGGPVDDADDLGLGVWAGVIPLELHALAPIADPGLREDIVTPDYAQRYARKRAV
jgi:nitroimidazol reductase NimA-like FMN-containing flavoprotein (pyridoxamine 5'-phosphate oxidase superfamily)